MIQRKQNNVLLFSVVALSWFQLVTSSSFEPYQLNGGLVSAVAGRNFAIIASDTRMIGEGGYVLESRNHLSTSAPILIGSSGCSTDCCQLQRNIRADFRAASYFGHISRSNPDMVANMLSSTLYERRGFPYYAFCVVAGLDQTTKSNGNYCGKVYVYDAIGSYERVAVAATGTGRELLQPILDRMFEATSSKDQVDGTANEAVEILCKAYRSVSEREIGVGDKLVIHVSEINSNDEVSRRVFVVPLKQH
ncbi:N-terminal nucleophile aminohydrolase [Fragilariopsis cylindrus CCMP1102]|uniref:N-terminal nucleophile aminohydrolase n=1 Tax=Fragilariopsis cylindrus CCMP1102 TaxID=635003 RepID=A0A1E7F4B5_9STRA|nr:N-terminal nucleophile aminohydrolase [Fragilariopsis cylindrus CCMP1102]|eukprot:OEU13028.1 N-terminal nucleophile aminohydrolase [Fragilariopsis cylindrus CCMP1102]